MAGRTPIPVARAMREISSNLDLARRQQRITVELLAARANLSVPTVRKMLNEGTGSFENFLRIARLLGFLDGVVEATNPPEHRHRPHPGRAGRPEAGEVGLITQRRQPQKTDGRHLSCSPHQLADYATWRCLTYQDRSS